MGSPSERHSDRAARTVLAIAGGLSVLVGFVLAVGGYLSPQEGSAFYMLVGLGLIVSGAMVAGRHRAGGWTYMVVFAVTLSWSLRNVGVGSSLSLRLVGPMLFLVTLALLIPPLCQWRPRRTVAVFALLIAGTVGLGISSLPKGPLAHQTAAATQFFDGETKRVLQRIIGRPPGERA